MEVWPIWLLVNPRDFRSGSSAATGVRTAPPLFVQSQRSLLRLSNLSSHIGHIRQGQVQATWDQQPVLPSWKSAYPLQACKIGLSDSPSAVMMEKISDAYTLHAAAPRTVARMLPWVDVAPLGTTPADTRVRSRADCTPIPALGLRDQADN